ncbi:MAG: sulfite exporter TauE/SafE family protein [Proteobacteria bacterium]|nr:sulfite exporter TauE/SafE family protein [Pseudomonadota bacterium]
MEELSVSLYLLAAILAVVAFAYSSVGLGGASAYTAIMAVAGMRSAAIPTVSLTLNLFVSSIGAFHFLRHAHGRLHLIAPFLVSSIPFSYIGGSLTLPPAVFYWVLLVTLVLVAIHIYLFSESRFHLDLSGKGKIIVSLLIGSVLGFVAGAIGIGGGVYLVPLIIIFGMGTEKEAAACGAVFVWLNSASGLLSRLQHQQLDVIQYWPLLVAVIIGAGIGSLFGATRFSPQTMQRFLGGIILVAIGFLIKKLLFV